MVRLLRQLLRPYWGSLIIILLAMLTELAASLATPWPLKIVLDHAVGPHPKPDWLFRLLGKSIVEDPVALITVAALCILLIAVLGAAANYVHTYVTESVGQWVANDLRIRVYHHLEQFCLAYFDKNQTATILSTITDDINTIEDFASSSTLGVLVDLMTIVGMVIVMFVLNFEFTLIIIFITPFLLMFIIRFKSLLKQATRKVRIEQSNVVAVVQQGLELERVVMAFGRQQLEEERLGAASRQTVYAALKARLIKSMLGPVVTLVVALCTAIVVWRGAFLITAGAMTIGTLTVFLTYLSQFFSPVKDLAKMTNIIAAAGIAVERVGAILDVDMSLPERPDAREAGPSKGEVIFKNVSFAYNEDAPVLKDVSFTIKPGQRVGIVGPTGCGKSTIVSLIPRFYDVSSGTVTIDGVDVRDYKLQALRGQIGFVLQDSVLFRGTVRENIAYGLAGATEEEIVRAAKLANADEFISKMPHGYDTPVGERGATLSGGQRARIGIARAIIRNSAMLILDEPTAALATESEELVMEALERLMKGKTAITIAHRLSTIRSSDKIIVMHDGRVVEEGTHGELLARGGLYADLHHAQLRGSEAQITVAAAS